MRRHDRRRADLPGHAAQQLGQAVDGRTIVALQEFPMSVGKRRGVQQIAGMGGETGERVGNRDEPRGCRTVQRAHRGQVFGQRARLQAAEVVFAPRRCIGEDECGDGFTQVAHVQHCDAPGGPARQGMQWPARDAPDPARAEPAFTVEQRGPYDVPVRAAGAQRGFAVALGTQETAAGVGVESQGGDMDQSQSALPARFGQRGGGEVVHAAISFAAALAQDADAVDHRVAIAERFVPIGGLQQRFEPRFAESEDGGDRRSAPPPRMAAADQYTAIARRERFDHVATDEAGATQDQYPSSLRLVQRAHRDGLRSEISVLTEIYGRTSLCATPATPAAMPADPLSPLSRRFVLHWGEMGSRWGVNRTVAQIHALLFLSGRPMHAEEIADVLVVARSNVSNSLRELVNLNLVRVVHLLGDRRDHFETSKDVWELFRTVVRERKAREFDPTVAMLREMAADPALSEEPPDARARIRETLALMGALSSWGEEMLRLEPKTLMKLMKLGGKIQKLLRDAG